MAEDSLFIAHREKGIGLIISAEIKRTKSNNAKYIWATLNLGGADQAVKCTIGRLAYTSYVLRYGYDSSDESESENVASMIGKFAKIQFEHMATLDDGKKYPTAFVTGVA